jgi:hypothetical protein
MPSEVWAKTLVAISTGLANTSGDGWSVVPAPDPQAPSGELTGVACSSSTDCEAIGSYVNSTGYVSALAEGWNGMDWVLQTVPGVKAAVGDRLSAVSCASSGLCEAVGYSTSSSNAESSFA